MHEYPATVEIVRLAQNAARSQNAVKVTKIALVIGDQSGYVGDSIHLYFDAVAKDTMCEGCELEIRRVRSMLQCEKCQTMFERMPFSFACPECGGEGHPSDIGNEFFIDYIEAIQGEIDGNQD